MKPTIEEVKEHFKDARIVKALNGREVIYNTNIRKGLHYWGNGVWVDDINEEGENNSGEIWNNKQGYAKIVRYKKHKNNNMKTLNRKDFKRIYNIACGGWKPKLIELYGNEFAVQDSVQISDDDYNKMRKACTPDQNILFDEIFGKDKKELNKWFVDKRYDAWLMYYTDKGTRYGRDYVGNWVEETDNCPNPYNDKDNRVATKEEVEQKLKKEAIKRGYKDGVKYKYIGDNERVCTLKGELELHVTGSECYLTDGHGGSVFENGKWAEIIKEEEKTYKIGQRFIIDGEKYILSSIACGKVILICLEDGNRLNEAVEVISIIKITKEEFKKISLNFRNSPVTLYKDVK